MAVLAVVLLSSVLAAAAQRPVKDDAGFFSGSAVAKAEGQLQQLQQKYNRSVMIETFAEPPAELRGRIGGDRQADQQAFSAYAQQRMYALGADVYVLIDRTPPMIESSTKAAAQSGLTTAGRDRMTADLLAAFRQKNYDGGLTNLADSLETTFANAQSRPGPAPAATPTAPPVGHTDPYPRTGPPPLPMPGNTGTSSGGLLGGIGCIGLIVLLVIVFLVFKLIGGLFGRRNPPPGYGQGYGQPGYGQPGYGPARATAAGAGAASDAGCSAACLGGLFGSWMGGNVFGGQHQTPVDPGHSSGGVFGGQDPGNPPDTGGTSGGSFGNDTGPGNFTDPGTAGGDFGGGGGDTGGSSDSGTSGGSF